MQRFVAEKETEERMFVPYWLIVLNRFVLILAALTLLVLTPRPLNPFTRFALLVALACCILAIATGYLLAMGIAR
jgi:hypothetical protein